MPQEKETASADIRKGNIVTAAKETIDTLPSGARRIQERKEALDAEKTSGPIISPMTQAKARENGRRRIYSKFRAKKKALLPRRSMDPVRLRKKAGRIRHMHSNTTIRIHPYYTAFFRKIQAFLAKIAFFVDNDEILVSIFM